MRGYTIETRQRLYNDKTGSYLQVGDMSGEDLLELSQGESSVPPGAHPVSLILTVDEAFEFSRMLFAAAERLQGRLMIQAGEKRAEAQEDGRCPNCAAPTDILGHCTAPAIVWRC